MLESLIIGVDLDNTLISYDDVIYHVALQRGLVPQGVRKSKHAVRDSIRQSQAGDRAWHAVQTVVYGERIEEARLIDGVPAFFAQCRARGISVFIVSHKTAWATADGRQVNLRDAAMAWMTRQGFFEAVGLGLSRSQVYFESTRAGKLTRISRLKCTHFIDDLGETFLDPSFPAGVQKLLYAAHGGIIPLPDVKVVATWKEISDYFFPSRD